MIQSFYTKFSKEIGRSTRLIPIPALKKAQDLYLKAVTKKDPAAFKEVFEIHRLAPSPGNKDEVEAINVIHHAFIEGRGWFEALQA